MTDARGPIPLLLDDGMSAKPGDRVWRWHYGGYITRSTVHKHWLTTGWKVMLHDHLFTTERAALEYALAQSKKRLSKAQQQARGDRRTIERLQIKLRSMDSAQ